MVKKVHYYFSFSLVNFKSPFTLIYLLLAATHLFAQNGSELSGSLSGFSQIDDADMLVNQYNGISYYVYDTVSADKNGQFDFNKKLREGFYELKVPAQGISHLIYANGKDDIDVSITNSKYKIDQAQFKDPENSALTELLSASQNLEIALNTLLEQFNPGQMDSMYLKKIGPHNQQVQGAYREFNKSVEKLKLKYPNTAVMNVFSSFYTIPLFDEDKIHGQFYDNQDAYMRDHFFDLWKLDDERVVRLPAIKSNIEKYFRYFAKKDYTFLIKTCDDLLNRAKTETIKKYLASVLMDFFSGVKEEDVVSHIVEDDLQGCLEGIDQNLINFNEKNLRGSQISELVLPSDERHWIDLASVYKSAPLTVLYFWTPDCIHCQEFHPVVAKVKKKYGKSINVYSVCLEDDKEKWKKAMSDFPKSFNNTIAFGDQKQKVAKDFGIHYTPMIYILNKSGEILEKGINGDDLEKSLKPYLQ